MSRTFKTFIPVLITVGDKSAEVSAEIEFSYIPGHPGTGPTYSCGGTPPDPAEVNDITLISLWDNDGNVLKTKRWMRVMVAEMIDTDELERQASQTLDSEREAAEEDRQERLFEERNERYNGNDD